MGGHGHPGENPVGGQSQQEMHTPPPHSKKGWDEGGKLQKRRHCNGQEHCVLLESGLAELLQCVYEACTLDICIRQWHTPK